MMRRPSWNERYGAGPPPWDIGRPDYNITEMVARRPILPCKVLEAGCGTGDNAMWLAQQGFRVTGVDGSERAIHAAREKASHKGVACQFEVLDFLEQVVAGAPFGFVFDRGCFHAFDSAEERSRFARQVALHLDAEGLWLTLVGSTDDPRGDRPGPPQRSALEVVTAVEPFFEVLSLQAGVFDSNAPQPPRAWIGVLKKRTLL